MYDSEYEEYDPEEWAELCERFADPGSGSALHAESAENPRDLPCPTCLVENVLTRQDRASGYQCNACADRAEGGGY